MPLDIAIIAGKKPQPGMQRGPMPMPKAFGDIGRASEPAQRSTTPMPSMDDNSDDETAETNGQYTIKPEAISYRGAEQKCSACEYMGQDGACKILKIPVEPEASCNAFEGGEDGASGVPDNGAAMMLGINPSMRQGA